MCITHTYHQYWSNILHLPPISHGMLSWPTPPSQFSWAPVSMHCSVHCTELWIYWGVWCKLNACWQVHTCAIGFKGTVHWIQFSILPYRTHSGVVGLHNTSHTVMWWDSTIQHRGVVGSVVWCVIQYMVQKCGGWEEVIYWKPGSGGSSSHFRCFSSSPSQLPSSLTKRSLSLLTGLLWWKSCLNPDTGET